jgi:hypothetical protein
MLFYHWSGMRGAQPYMYVSLYSSTSRPKWLDFNGLGVYLVHDVMEYVADW